MLSRPFDGVPALLDTLAGSGATLAVCTNKFEGLSRSLLRQLGPRRALRRDRRTRHVRRVQAATRATSPSTIAVAGGRADRAVMVGDSEVDIATASAAGVPSIGVTFGYTPVPVRELQARRAVIDHYREFMAALEQVLPRG